MIDLNKYARTAMVSAVLRGKVSITSDLDERHANLKSLYEEVEEVKQASELHPSEHLPNYTEVEEELADVLIGTLTELTVRGVNVEKIIRDKVRFNNKRKD